MKNKSKLKKTVALILVAIAIVVIMVLLLKANKETTQKRVYQFDKEKPISVQVATLKQEEVNAELAYNGSFEPNKETKISAEIQGKINAVLVDMGSNVKAGQALIQLDNSLLKFQLQSIDVQIEGLEADVKRYTVLSKAEAIQGVQLEKAILGLKSAKVQKATLLEQINKTTIKAPFSGVVTAKLCEAGAFAAPGIPLIQITEIAKLKFTINVPEKELNQFELGQKYQLTADAFSSNTMSCEVAMIGGKANIGNSFTVQFSVVNTPDLKIKSGMSGSVFVSNTDNQKQIVISSSSIVGTNIKPQVYKVKQGKAMLNEVYISKRIGNKVIIDKGLAEGDVIVTNGFINLFDGANVIIK